MMMNLFFLAQGGGSPASPAAGFLSILPLILFFFVFYWLFVATPMKKKQKAFQELMKGLKNGDRVVTTSGMHGVVTGITEKLIRLRVANNVVVDFDKSAIAGLATEDTKEEKK